ncbi:complexin-2 isoform X2 [Rhinolophus ferrumequinum]|uniref:complexin-2 isoform X2 n=1 Tax=Rhinolophus ferrumequinum TaxID=59479 RepID=UPI00140FF299|nr:complexin-2 isoform X2 [Rhinolophus ferrumequinum]
MENSSMPPCWFHRHFCWSPLSSPSAAPASFLRKLGSPWERGCPWGRPLSSVPCSSADIPGRRKGARCPPHAHVLARAGGRASAEESRNSGRERLAAISARAPRSATEELQPPTGSRASLECYLLCSLIEVPCISALPGKQSVCHGKEEK